MLRWGLLAMLLFGLTELTAQDTTRVRPHTLAYATPALLIVSGTIMNNDRRYITARSYIDDIWDRPSIRSRQIHNR